MTNSLKNFLKSETLFKRKDDELRPFYIQDADRIIFSDPFRRLANKTQVHPLYEDDHLHTRLTHSLEVSQVGASLARTIVNRLGLDAEDQSKVAGCVSAACLAHDLGNPPFGHSGEAAISQFFEEYFGKQDSLQGNEATLCDLKMFEGNAQGFRVLTALEMYGPEKGGMDLSVTTLGAFVKYPYGSAFAQSDEGNSHSVKKSKYGVFYSEEQRFKDLMKTLQVRELFADKYWARHPLVYIVEAADDICYKIIDIEDAARAGIITLDTAIDSLHRLYEHSVSKKPSSLSEARSEAIGECIKQCATCFEDNKNDILSGNWGLKALYDEAPKLQQGRDKVNELTKNEILVHRRKTDLEVQGRNAIWTILDGLTKAMKRLEQAKFESDGLDSYSEQLFRAAGFLKSDQGKFIYSNIEIIDADTALRACADFVSGMTDRYAIKFASRL